MSIPKYLLARSKKLRKEQTPAENRLWVLVKGKNLGGYKIRRQHVILNYIVDFFCYSEKLIIELDGPIHNTQKARDYDQRREDILKANGYRILRFKNAFSPLGEMSERSSDRGGGTKLKW